MYECPVSERKFLHFTKDQKDVASMHTACAIRVIEVVSGSKRHRQRRHNDRDNNKNANTVPHTTLNLDMVRKLYGGEKKDLGPVSITF